MIFHLNIWGEKDWIKKTKIDFIKKMNNRIREKICKNFSLNCYEKGTIKNYKKILIAMK